MTRSGRSVGSPVGSVGGEDGGELSSGDSSYEKPKKKSLPSVWVEAGECADRRQNLPRGRPGDSDRGMFTGLEGRNREFARRKEQRVIRTLAENTPLQSRRRDFRIRHFNVPRRAHREAHLKGLVDHAEAEDTQGNEEAISVDGERQSEAPARRYEPLGRCDVEQTRPQSARHSRLVQNGDQVDPEGVERIQQLVPGSKVR